jgi:hypothetical protein
MSGPFCYPSNNSLLRYLLSAAELTKESINESAYNRASFARGATLHLFPAFALFLRKLPERVYITQLEYLPIVKEELLEVNEFLTNLGDEFKEVDKNTKQFELTAVLELVKISATWESASNLVIFSLVFSTINKVVEDLALEEDEILQVFGDHQYDRGDGKTVCSFNMSGSTRVAKFLDLIARIRETTFFQRAVNNAQQRLKSLHIEIPLDPRLIFLEKLEGVHWQRQLPN